MAYIIDYTIVIIGAGTDYIHNRLHQSNNRNGDRLYKRLHQSGNRGKDGLYKRLHLSNNKGGDGLYNRLQQSGNRGRDRLSLYQRVYIPGIIGVNHQSLQGCHTSHFWGPITEYSGLGWSRVGVLCRIEFKKNPVTCCMRKFHVTCDYSIIILMSHLDVQ